MRYLGCEKDSLTLKVSVGRTSFDLGVLASTRYLAQARDWSVRESSVLSGWRVSDWWMGGFGGG